MNRNGLYPSKYLKANPDVLSDILVTIRDVIIEVLGQELDEKPVIYFDETRKGLVLNQTNFNNIARICGSDETNDWVGQKIVLTTEMIIFRGQTGPAIRIRQPAPRSEVRAARPAPTPQPAPGGFRDELNDEIPFAKSWRRTTYRGLAPAGTSCVGSV
jgi:hypothetical protein